jgi:hypothetical protein
MGQTVRQRRTGRVIWVQGTGPREASGGGGRSARRGLGVSAAQGAAPPTLKLSRAEGAVVGLVRTFEADS